VTTNPSGIDLTQAENRVSNKHDIDTEEVHTISVIANNDDLIFYVTGYNSKCIPDWDHSGVNC